MQSGGERASGNDEMISFASIVARCCHHLVGRLSLNSELPARRTHFRDTQHKMVISSRAGVLYAQLGYVRVPPRNEVRTDEMPVAWGKQGRGERLSYERALLTAEWSRISSPSALLRFSTPLFLLLPLVDLAINSSSPSEWRAVAKQ